MGLADGLERGQQSGNNCRYTSVSGLGHRADHRESATFNVLGGRGVQCWTHCIREACGTPRERPFGKLDTESRVQWTLSLIVHTARPQGAGVSSTRCLAKKR